MKWMLLFLALVAVVGLHFTVGRPALSARPMDATIWKESIVAEGPARAYAEFKTEYEKKPFALQHIAAHTIGAALYDSVGTDGFSTCDESFAFGCFHGFFSRAVADKGAGIIATLADACRAKYGDNATGCEHGIGHGIMEYLGFASLVKGLALCDETHQADPRFGCTSGVFMEYNDRISFSTTSAKNILRKPDSANMHAPCNTVVPERFRDSCYFEIGLWWKDVLGPEYEKIGNMCADAPAANRESCWKGWGAVVAENVGYGAEKAKQLCGLIHEKRGAEFCDLGVAMRFFGTGTETRAGERMCEGLDADIALSCQRLSH